jgi:type I restriction enzyme M protein
MNDTRSTVWRAMDLLRGPLDTSAARNLILALLYLRASDPENWERIRSSPGFNVVDSLRRDPEIREFIGQAGAYDGVPGRMFAQLVDIMSSATGREELAAAFEQLLEYFADFGQSRDSGFYTPKSVTKVLASVLAVGSASTFYDPACGFGELLVAATTTAAGRSARVATYGSALNTESLHVSRMNLTLHGIENNIFLHGFSNYNELPESPRTFSRILANPPFSQRWSDFHPEPVRYSYRMKGRAEFTWLDHAIRSLDPDGRAAVVMPNGTLSSANRYDIATRQRMLEEGCVEAVVALPPDLFQGTRIPVCIWLLLPPGSVQDQILLIDASSAGHMIDRTRREISGEEIAEIAEVIRKWRSDHSSETASNAASVSIAQIRERNYNLSPGLYVKAPPPIADLSSAEDSVELLMNRLASLEEVAEEKDAVAEQLLRRLKWLAPSSVPCRRTGGK